MKSSTRPASGLAMSVLLLVAGWYMSTRGAGAAELFGWFFLVVGVLACAINLMLLIRSRSSGGSPRP
ncbi:MAG: hypothetical protein QM582_18515 [Micropruina sp.]|uniref:hypothetical protein n=1 Tax=Micropruina sp. TaxID=2737536 RepID=UPI0039E478C7